MSTTLNMKILRSTTSPCNAVTPQMKSLVKRKVVVSVGGVTAKVLKFSPHIFKKELVTTEGKEYSLNGGLQLVATDTNYKGEEDDDIIEIDGL